MGAMRALLVALCLALGALGASGHGLLLWPRSRNWIAYLDQNFYWSHGLNAGGYNAVGDNGRMRWPAGRHGMCGDAWNESRWDTPGPVQATYVEGQEVSIDVVIAVNHAGYLEFSLCDLDARAGDNKCRQLQRADGKGPHFWLPFVSNWTGGNSGYVRPAYGDGSFAWYQLPEIKPPEGCKKQQLCNAFKDMVVYRTKWMLPSGYSCRHCKLQWHYQTAHSCWPPCLPQNQGEPTCRNVQVYPECGKPGTTYPERFWNCADVTVLSAASRASAALTGSTTPWEGKLSMQAPVFGRQDCAYKMGETNRCIHMPEAAGRTAARPAAPALVPAPVPVVVATPSPALPSPAPAVARAVPVVAAGAPAVARAVPVGVAAVTAPPAAAPAPLAPTSPRMQGAATYAGFTFNPAYLEQLARQGQLLPASAGRRLLRRLLRLAAH